MSWTCQLELTCCKFFAVLYIRKKLVETILLLVLEELLRPKPGKLQTFQIVLYMTFSVFLLTYLNKAQHTMTNTV